MKTITFDEILEETDKAFQVILNNVDTWLAKTNCERHGNSLTFDVTPWLAKKIIAAAS